MLKLFTDAGESSRDSEVFEVGARVEWCLRGNGGDGDTRVKVFFFEMDAEYSLPISFGGKIDKKATWKSAQGGFVEIKRPVCGDHNEGGEIVHAIPFAEELIDEFAMGAAVGAPSSRAEDGVCFVDKDNAGGEFLGE